MKKIILIDLNCILIDSLSKSKLLEIDTIIIGFDSKISYIKEKYKVKNVFSMESINEFYITEDINLDYDLIKNFRDTQLKVEHFFSRVTTDINSIQYIYYSALSYWYEKFKSDDIYAVFSAGLEYGSTFDTVIYDIAKKYNKKVLIMEVAMDNGTISANQLFNYVTKKYMKINPISNGLKPLNVNDFLFNAHKIVPNIKSKSMKDLVRKILNKVGGYLLINFINQLLGRFRSIHHSFEVSYWTYLKNYLYTKNLSKYYKLKCVEIDTNKKYIYYSLHVEPEASTLARVAFYNQLVIIKTISQCLPDGWILYVKDHPHQSKDLNNASRYYFLTTIEKFRTKRFYDEISKLKNVYLLSLEVDSKIIVKHAQAIACINGTVIVESINNNKPLLIFSQETTPFTNVEGVNDINNLSECRLAINRIEFDNKINYTNYT
ncbi:hypothetical protein, partial [Sulfurimonas sp.]|uniref:capsular polysaccharide export protein, LipB/KpsS family n=1 Tax=Sulfurimonas sp. TaxID=2022749 RepID=UPI0025FD27D8